MAEAVHPLTWKPVRRTGAVAAAAFATALAVGCGAKKTATPTGPIVVTPLPIVAVFPAPYADRISDTSPAWAEFSVPLDSLSVSTRTVFLKLDTRRLSIAVRWEAATRRIRITPLEHMELRSIYTVELSPQITSHGLPLGRGFLWQFKTTGLRLPDSPQPMDGAAGESPFTALRWAGLTPGNVRYEVLAGPDSTALADSTVGRLGPPAPPAPFLPSTRWSQSQTNYWRVHAIDLDTGEARLGPIWRFGCLPASTPIDSTILSSGNWGYVDLRYFVPHCFADSIGMGQAVSGIRWSIPLSDTTVRFAGVTIEMTPRYYPDFPAEPGATVWSAPGDWPQCSRFVGDTPRGDRLLGVAEVLRPDRVRFSDDRLTAHTEAAARIGGYYGYMFQAPHWMVFWAPSFFPNPNTARMTIYRYRTATPAASP